MRDKITKSDRHLIICMGNEIKGDDAVAIKLGNQLQKSMDNVLVVHNVPGSFTGKIVKYKPDMLIFIDAVDISGLEPGTILQIPRDKIVSSGSMTTHYQEFGDLMKLMEKELGYELEIVYLGIQIKQIELLQPMSVEVESSLNKLLQVFQKFTRP